MAQDRCGLFCLLGLEEAAYVHKRDTFSEATYVSRDTAPVSAVALRSNFCEHNKDEDDRLRVKRLRAAYEALRASKVHSLPASYSTAPDFPPQPSPLWQVSIMPRV